ncbi:MAG: CHAT domain-containing protein [Rhodanobacteraceae bacterium]
MRMASAASPQTVDAAETTARSALSAAEHHHGAQSHEVADALAALVDAERDDFRVETHPAEVEALARREVALRAQLDGQMSLAYAEALARLGYALSSRFANDEAAQQFEHAHAIVAALGDRADAAARANAELDLGYIRRLQRRDLDEAVVQIEAGLELAPGLSPLRRAQALLWLAGCEWYLRQRDRFVTALERADAALHEADAERRPEHADLLRWRAIAELDAGHFPAAIELGDRALANAAQARPYSVTVHTIVLDSRGQIELRLGDFARAQHYYEQALALQASQPTGGGYYLAMMHYELCANLGFQKDLKHAEPHCRAAVQALEALPSPPPMELAGAYNNLGGNLADQGRDAEAMEPLRRSILNSEKIGRLAPLSFTAEIGLADIHLYHGDYAEAEKLFRRHLARVGTHDEFSLKNPRSTQAGLAAALWGEKRFDEAFASAAAAERSAELVRRVTASDLDEHRALDVIDHIDGGLDWMVAIAAATHDEQKIQAVWQAVVDANGTIAAMTARRLAAARAARTPGLAHLWQRWQQHNAALAQARVELARNPTPQSHAALIEAVRAFDKVEIALAARTGMAGERLKTAHGDFAAARAALPPDTALLRFIEIAVDGPASFQRVDPPPRPQLYALLADRHAPLLLLPLGDAGTVQRAADRWYRQVADAKSAATDLSQASRALRRLIWDPLAGAIHARRVMLIPSIALSRVNFAALEADDGRYLIEIGPQFHVLDHERELLRAPLLPNAPTLLIAGAPDFAVRAEPADTLRGACPGLRSAPFAPLPGARAEVRALSRQAANDALDATLLEGAAATEAAVRDAIPQKSILHFATHGIFLGQRCAATDTTGARGVVLVKGVADTPDLSRLSALAFSGANGHGGDSANDGLLTSEEITALDLSATQWAVLSACETALGDVTAQEGVLGLRRAFHLAGAHSVIMSLWRVDDRATTDFMRALYRARLDRHADTIDSLYAAMRETLAARRKAGESALTFYWGGFIAAGDWR